MLFRVDTASEVPLWEQLSASIRSGAIAGRLTPGERLPSARELAASLDINVHTVLRAYQLMRDEGLIDLRRGRGAIVTARRHDYGELTTAIGHVVTEARARGISATALAALIREAYP